MHAATVGGPVVIGPVTPTVLTANLTTLPHVSTCLQPFENLTQAGGLGEGGCASTAPPILTIATQGSAGSPGNLSSQPSAQTTSTTDPLSAPIVSFDGIGFPCNGAGCNGPVPPDTNGAVGPNHYFQTVNAQFAIYDKHGTLLAGPTNINQMWVAANTMDACQVNNSGDPIVLYDHLANRWLLSQFVAFSNECIAISRTADPVGGGWFLYNFPCPSGCNNLDYPKLGLWPDAYYMGSNCCHAWAFDRIQMLLGNAATAIRFSTPTSFMLPSDLKGPPPPAGAPNIFVRQIDGLEFGGVDRLQMDAFHVDFTTPALSTFTALPDLPTSLFNSNLCGFGFRTHCIPDPAGSRLDTIRGVPMYPLMYRNFGDHETLTVNHDVNISGHAGIRWYELRKVAGAWSIFQQGDYSPDSTNRWMGSMSMDTQGNIALGYSVSDNTTFPGIRYTGRLSSDPLGTMPQAEQTLMAGSKGNDLFCSEGSPCPRWGDYSAMQIDPVDGCTFWYTTEYFTVSRPGWSTRVGSFRFSDCTAVNVSKFFTDSSLSPLPLDRNGNPKVDVVLSRGIVKSTNPGQVLAWVNVTNIGVAPVQSLKVNETLPVDWTVDPPWMPAVGAIHVFFENTTSLATNPDITQPSTISVSTGNPETVQLASANLAATAIGHPLMPGQSILLSVKLIYALKGTSQSASSYPRNYTDTAVAAAWAQASFTGTESTGSASAFFIADAEVVS